MKKIIIGVLGAVVILIIVVALSVHFFLDGAVKQGVQTIGPKLTKVEVKLDSVNLSLLSGSGKIKGLVLGNPQGFKTPSAINVGTASLALKPGSLLSSKIVVPTVDVEGPEVTLETSLQGNNLKQILANLQETTGGGQKEPSRPNDAKAGKKLQVDDFLVTGGKIRLSVSTPLGEQSGTVPLPEIHLKDLGKDSDGLTAAELSKAVLEVVLKKAIEAGATAVAELGKGGVDLSKSLGAGATGSVEKVTKGIGDLFKKKP